MRKLLFFASILFIFLTSSSIVYGNETNDTSDYDGEIQNLDKKIVDLEDEIDELESVKEEYEEDLHHITEDMTELEIDIINSKNEINKTEKKIEKLAKQIESLTKEIKQKELEIEEKNKELEKQRVKLGQTISFLYENRELSIFDFIFGGENLDEIINGLDFINIIANENKSIHDNIIEEERKLNEIKESLQEDRDEVDAVKIEEENLNKEQIENKLVLEDLMLDFEKEEANIIARIEANEQEKEKAMENMVKYIQEKEAIYRKQEEEAKRIAEEERLAKEAEEERKRLEKEAENKNKSNNNTNNEGTGSNDSIKKPTIDPNATFQMPMASGYRFTSGYGSRVHPITGVVRMHQGVDLAAPIGTPIFAAADGIVLFAGPANGYGNWVVIAHDNGYYTIYGHMRRDMIYVSEGQYVFAGHHIAGVGSEGGSTGPHLHFEIADGYNGNRSFSRVNPTNFLSF